MADASTIARQNGNGAGNAPPAWEPESPFLSSQEISYSSALVQSRPAPARASTIESPFTAEYAGEEPRAGGHAEAFANLMGELHDEEFAEALEDLVNDASAVLEDAFAGEIGDAERDRFAMERTVRDYLAPLQLSAEELIDRVATELADRDVAAMSEQELDELLSNVTPFEGELSPAFEGFLSGVLKKARAAVSGAMKAASTVAGAIAMPHMLILNRLKGLIRPLLERVLRFAIDKLPIALRPLAGQLAQRFLGIRPGAAPAAGAARPRPAAAAPTMTTAPVAAMPPADGADGGDGADARVDASAADPAALEAELDTRLAGYLLAGEDFEQEAATEELSTAYAAANVDPMQTLDRARQEFADAVVRQEDSEDAGPALEQFVPAILAALKLGIRVVGRPRVVKFLSGLLASLIGKYIGKAQAPALSNALVDSGLRLMSLEAPTDEQESFAGHAIAATVEDTMNRLVQTAPAAAWENEPMLETYAYEAFQQAAAAHFPDPYIREELHETANTSGAWTLMPQKSPRKRYKKFSRVIDVAITPQIAAAVKTFGGHSLRSFLKDRLGIVVDQPVRARVHVYEAIPGTRLSLIALHERGVTGLGHARRHGWSLFHPLTPEAAGVLLHEPGLGKPVPAAFLVRRRVTAVGQRFYYLEVPGARVRLVPRASGRAARPARSSQARVLLDFVKRRLRVALYYGEADAQELAKQLRQKLPLTALLKLLKGRHDAHIAQALTGTRGGGLRIVHEQAPTEELAAPLIATAMRAVGPALSELLVTCALDALKRELEARREKFVADFEKAAQADEDGVTIVLTYDAPPLLEQLRRVLKPNGTPAALPTLSPAGIGAGTVEIHPGFVRR